MSTGVRKFLGQSQTLRHLIYAARELRASASRARMRAFRSRAIRRYLAGIDIPKLQIGAFDNPLDGWLNTDLEPRQPGVLFLDATRTFPLPDQSMQYAFCEHMIEHIPLDAARFMLGEMYRVLKPGGKVRIATPNLEQILKLLHCPPNSEQEQYLKLATQLYLPRGQETRSSFVINAFFRLWGHQFLYDPPTLQWALEQAGFQSVKFSRPGESDDPALRGIEGHMKVIGDECNAYETMVAEATK